MKAAISDLERELWLRLRDSGELKWTTRDGIEIPIKDMSDEHLVNAIKAVSKNIEMSELACEYESYLWDLD